MWGGHSLRLRSGQALSAANHKAVILSEGGISLREIPLKSKDPMPVDAQQRPLGEFAAETPGSNGP